MEWLKFCLEEWVVYKDYVCEQKPEDSFVGHFPFIEQCQEECKKGIWVLSSDDTLVFSFCFDNPTKTLNVGLLR